MPTDEQTQSSKQEFQYGRSIIEYELRYEARRNLAITVRPDKSVLVRAPLGSDITDIKTKLVKRGEWILKQINYFDKFHPIQPPRQYVSGETHYYLGRQYRLRIRKGSDESVRLSGKFFIVTTRNPEDSDQVKLLMLDWYAPHGQAIFDQRIRKMAPEILGVGYESLEIEYGLMKTRWGSCAPNRKIKVNIELIKSPLPCIDYVIIHELSHLLFPNHDKKFYRLLDKVLPDWRERKERLEQFGLNEC
ncbi:MAG: M48 family peptidase [Anaerolineae bacterium]|nr:MAG: M48 family peptidase [Anaerolineae bacterium]